ncbi:MAG TPA: HPF/RaiA family ribosome-associated protein [Verrucomicrobiae bacterium]|nr:HPF/RaiA family ribosome-associated protein [Verrucomicrobiae bacterium]
MKIETNHQLPARPGCPPFELSINALGITLTERLRTASIRKIGRVRPIAPGAIRATVDLQRDGPKRSPNQFRVFVRYEVPGYDIVAEHRADDPLVALDGVADKIERRLRKRKTASLAARSRRRVKPVRIAELCPADFEYGPFTTHSIV